MTDHDDLEIARSLAAAGIAVFVAYPDPDKPGEFKPPKGWQATTPNPAYAEAWKPGRALCAVMGRGLDLVDTDPRNGGDLSALGGIMPEVLGVAATPSGGTHVFVRSMGVRSRDGVLPGIDVKAGDPEGQGRGFAFIAPTVRTSKTTGEPVAYRWIMPPDLTRLNGSAPSGSPLAELVRKAHGSHRQPAGPGFSQPDTWWGNNTGPIPSGERHSKLVSYAGKLRDIGLPLPEAGILMLRRWEDCEQPPAAAFPVTREEALDKLHDVYNRYEAASTEAEATGSPQPVPDLPDVDLGALAELGIKEPERIADGMLYPGCVHCLAGMPGGGKTTLMAWWMLLHIRDGGRVLLLDEEAGPEQAAEKFLDLGATPDELRSPRFSYVPFPSRGWNSSDLAQLHARITERAPGIIGWDSVAAFLAIAGADENSAADVTKFWQKVLIPCARQHGAAVIGVDHTVKNADHGGYGRGSGAKKAASDVLYIIETLRPFNRQQDGLLRLTTSPGKDRRGWLALAYEIHVKVGEKVTLNVTEANSYTIQGNIVMGPGKANLWEALNAIATEGNPVTAQQLVDWIVAKGRTGLKRPTRSSLLNELAADGLADSISVPGQREKYWYPLSTVSDNRRSDVSADTSSKSFTSVNDLALKGPAKTSRSSYVSASSDASALTRHVSVSPLIGADAMTGAADADTFSAWPPGSIGEEATR